MLPRERERPDVKFLDLLSAPKMHLPITLGVCAEKPQCREFPQLSYIQKYVRELGAQSFAWELSYVDRDYIEDYSAFYSRNFRCFGNRCQRIHFFKDLKASAARKELRRLVALGRKSGEDIYRAACRRFSEKHYLGFSVIKPLDKSPVGRTILRPYPNIANGHRREMGATEIYSAHLLGVELTTIGLPFQQQDEGVSACATTALWSALHKVCSVESISVPTPAKITHHASRGLHRGRMMPQQGLAIEEMCHSVEELGLAACVYSVEDFLSTRSILFAATKSNFPTVIVLQEPVEEPTDPEDGGNTFHAVTTVGMKIHPKPLPPNESPHFVEAASFMSGLYVHDDRNGPYIRSRLTSRKVGDSVLPNLEIEKLSDSNKKKWEAWHIRELIIALHPKIRISFDVLWELSRKILVDIYSFAEFSRSTRSVGKLEVEYSIQRGFKYIESLFLEPTSIDAKSIEEFCKNVGLSRYVCVFKFRNSRGNGIDILLDSTSTKRNPFYLAVIARGVKKKSWEPLLNNLAYNLDCVYLI